MAHWTKATNIGGRTQVTAELFNGLERGTQQIPDIPTNDNDREINVGCLGCDGFRCNCFGCGWRATLVQFVFSRCVGPQSRTTPTLHGDMDYRVALLSWRGLVPGNLLLPGEMLVWHC